MNLNSARISILSKQFRWQLSNLITFQFDICQNLKEFKVYDKNKAPMMFHFGRLLAKLDICQFSLIKIWQLSK